MIDILFYEYGIDIDDRDLKKINNKENYFYIDYRKYYIYKTNIELQKISDIGNLLRNYLNNYNVIVKTLKGKYYVSDNGINYVVIRSLNPENAEISSQNLVLDYNIQNYSKSLICSNWGILWERKLDYLEIKIYDILNKSSLVKNLMPFYKGLAENAIFYFNRINNKNSNLTIQHKRIFFPNIAKNYYNPLYIVIDYRVRDIAEYVKSLFWYSDYSTSYIINILNNINLTESEANLFYARLLFPTSFLDELEYCIDNKEYSLLTKYELRVNEYILFLRKIWIYLNEKKPLQRIKWLIEEH